MRVKVAANDLKVGQICYLPFFGSLRRSKILEINKSKEKNLLTLTYVVFCSELNYKNVCTISEPNIKDFLIYKRPK